MPYRCAQDARPYRTDVETQCSAPCHARAPPRERLRYPKRVRGEASYLVRTPLGVCVVTLARGDLDLGDRGGFDARWVDADGEGTGGGEVIGLETFRGRVKAHLRAAYRGRHGRDPGAVALNLSSHQLIDDLIGWTKLNWRDRSR